jgi:hypothetical protein
MMVYDEENKAIILTDCNADLVKVFHGELLLGEIPMQNKGGLLSNVEHVIKGDAVRLEKHIITNEEVML